MALSVESLMLEVGKAFEPLEQRLRGDEIPLLFAEIGLPAPDIVLAAQAVGNAVEGAATALSGLPRSLSDLAAAIEADDAGRIAESVAAVGSLIKTVAAGVDVVSGAVRAAAATAGPNRAEVEAFAGELAERLFGFALITYLEDRKPIAANVLELIGVLESTPIAATPGAPTYVRRVLRLDRVSGFLHDPVGTLTDLYRWGGKDFDWDLLLQRLSIFLTTVSNFAFLQSGPPPFLRVTGVDVGRTDDTVPGVQAALRVAANDHLQLTVPVNDSVALVATSDAAMGAETAVKLLPPADLRIIPPSGEVRGSARFGVQAPPAAGGPPLVVLGTAGGSRVEARALRITAGADLDWNPAEGRAEGDLVIEAAVEGGKVVLNLADADGFLGTLLPVDSIELDADVGLTWSSATGLRFRGTAGIEADVPVDLHAGPVDIRALHLGLGLTGDGVALEVSGSIAAQLGPITAVADRTGAVLRLSQAGGALGLTADFKPPSGVGLTIAASGASGGGFLSFDPDRGEYAGALDLELPDFLAVKGDRADHHPPARRFAGLLAADRAHRGVRLRHPARRRVHTAGRRRAARAEPGDEPPGARGGRADRRDRVGRVPQGRGRERAADPVRPGPVLPARAGHVPRRPDGQDRLGHADAHQCLGRRDHRRSPATSRSSAWCGPRCRPPTSRYWCIQAQFVGALETDKSRLWFFAKLFDSRIMGMTIEGGMGLLVAWGDDPD